MDGAGLELNHLSAFQKHALSSINIPAILHGGKSVEADGERHRPRFGNLTDRSRASFS